LLFNERDKEFIMRRHDPLIYLKTDCKRLVNSGRVKIFSEHARSLDPTTSFVPLLKTNPHFKVIILLLAAV
jgi:hypothetical protein